MKRIIISLACFWFAALINAQTITTDAQLEQKVSAFLDAWHDDAAHARWAYFDKMAPQGVYIGTDQSERWTRDAFKEWATPFFTRGKAWSFKAFNRHVRWSADQSFIWFDEQLQTQMGICQATGVLRNTEKGLLIEHYQLSMTVPNGVNDAVVKVIRDFQGEKKAR